MTNPYIAYALLIYAGLDGINNGMKLPKPSETNIGLEPLPKFWGQAADIARQSSFIKGIFKDDVDSFIRR